MPFQIEHQIDELEKVAAHRCYIEGADDHEMVAEGMRIGMHTSLRALVNGLIRSGHRDPEVDPSYLC